MMMFLERPDMLKTNEMQKKNRLYVSKLNGLLHGEEGV
jgi:hypothetical protein